MNQEITFSLIRHCPTISKRINLPYPFYYLASQIYRPRLAVVLAQGLELNNRLLINPETGELTSGKQLLLYSSPIRRCVQTAQELASVTLAISKNCKANFKFPNSLRNLGFGEPFSSLRSRTQKFLQGIEKEVTGPSEIIVCSHREVLSAIVSELQGGAPLTPRIMNMYAAPGEITIVTGNGKVQEVIKPIPQNYPVLRPCLT